MHKHHRDCRSICENNGLTVLRVEHRSKHLAVVCEEGMIIMPSTPSDRRWRYNASAQARRIVRGL
jgi:adenosyl cobinamide kinase/adenosyl cobinamide phosphate guanylyltransferase